MEDVSQMFASASECQFAEIVPTPNSKLGYTNPSSSSSEDQQNTSSTQPGQKATEVCLQCTEVCIFLRLLLSHHRWICLPLACDRTEVDTVSKNAFIKSWGQISKLKINPSLYKFYKRFVFLALNNVHLHCPCLVLIPLVTLPHWECLYLVSDSPSGWKRIHLPGACPIKKVHVWLTTWIPLRTLPGAEILCFPAVWWPDTLRT